MLNETKLKWKRTKEYNGLCGTVVSKTVDGVWELHKDHKDKICIFNRTSEKNFAWDFGCKSVPTWKTQKDAKEFLERYLDCITEVTM